MYLSKNSRYVLKRARVFSPKIFKVAQNNLSVKTPNDDPTKPPLRVNIPKETSEEEIYAKSVHTVGESKPRNFATISQGPSISPTIDEELLPKCESEIRFPTFVSDNILMTSDLDRTSTASSIDKTSSKDDYIQSLQMIIKDETTEGALDNKGKEPSTSQSFSAGDVNSEQKNPEIPTGGDSKSLYIIIDVPEYRVHKSVEPGSPPESAPEVIKSHSVETTDFEKITDQTAFRAKTDRPKPEESFLKKTVSKFPSLKKKPSRTKRFDISEIEEPATYVFHLRFNKQNGNKPSTVGRVPEKEFRTRNDNFSSNYVHIKITGNEAKIGKHVASLEEFSSIKPADLSKKSKTRKSGDSKTNLLRVSKSSSSAISQQEAEGKASDVSELDDAPFQQKFLRKAKNYPKKNTSKSERDNATVKPKNYPFKFPTMTEEGKTLQEGETQPGSPAQKELSATEANLEHKSTKVETTSETDKNNYEWPTQTNSAKAAQQEATGKSFPSSSQEQNEQNEQNANVNWSQKAEPAEANQGQKEATEYYSHYYGAYDPKQYRTQQTSAQQQTEAAEHRSPYINISELKEQTPYENQTQQTNPTKDAQHQEQTTEYYAYYSAKKSKEKKANKNRHIRESQQNNSAMTAQQQQQATEYYYPYYSADESKQQKANESQTDRTTAARADQQQEQSAENASHYMNISDLKRQTAYENSTQQTEPSYAVQQQEQYASGNQTQKTDSVRAGQQREQAENSPLYYSIHEHKEQNPQGNESQQAQEKKKKQTSRKPMKKKSADSSSLEKSSPSKPESVKPEKKAINFQTSSTSVTIGCEQTPQDAYAKFCAAFPPLLSEALRSRLKLRSFFLKDKSGVPLNNEKNASPELSENAILFPRNEPDKFDCESLFESREETILNIIKTSEKETATGADEKITKPAEGTSPGTENSVDSLTVMKKVKEIVQFDLDNAVKIFNAEESKQDVPSVVFLKDGRWKVDSEELNAQRQKSQTRMKDAFGAEFGKELNKDGLGDKITEESHPTKYLPSATANEMKLDSVIMYDSKTDQFFINKDTLAKTISQKTNSCLEEVNQTLNFLAQRDTVGIKGGDSILVFDDETQSWKVDFSILEKREQQMKIEEELTKRSELILETFEQLEKGQVAKVPLPGTRDKKIFDYKNEQWKAYSPEKKTKESTSKQKSPFREPDAEEIRKKNSDMYENLFVANKKETKIKKSGKNAPGFDPSKHVKKSKSCILADGKKESAESGSQKGSESTPIKPPEPPKEGPNPPPPEKRTPIKKDDNFWETFLNMNILPRDIRDIPKINPLKPPEPPKPPTPEKKPPTPSAKLPTPEKTTPVPAAKLPTPEKKPSTPAAKLPTPEKKPSTPAAKLPTPEKKPSTPAAKLPTPEKKPSTPSAKLPTPEKTPLTPPSNTLPEAQKKIDEPRFKIRIPFIKEKKTDKPTDTSSESKKDVKSEETPKKPPKQPSKTTTDDKEKPALKTPPPASSSIPKEDPKGQKPPPKSGPSKEPTKAEPFPSSSHKEPPLTDPPLKIGEPKESPKIMDPPSMSKTKQEDPKPPFGEKVDKLTSATDHYVSDKIIEISRNKPADSQAKIKTNKVETVKVNITPDKRLPSKVTEINLNKKCEEKVKETQQNTGEGKKSSDGTKQDHPGEKTFYKNLEKYKTPFSDPDYEEKSLKIKSDIESNPNLKKLDNWSKTLVLQDIMKPPENIESWLKDETDKMATLLLKVLQEAADGKPKKKNPNKSKEKPGKGNPYDNIRKKQETSPENFLFRVRTVNLSLENDKKPKPGDSGKLTIKPDHLKDIPVQSENTVKSANMIDPSKLPETGKELSVTEKCAQVPVSLENSKSATDQTVLETAVQSAVISREFSHANKLPVEISEEIPGPELLKKISNAWKVFPILGSQMTIFTLLRVFQLVNLGSSIFSSQNPDRSRRHAFTKLFVKYGPIVNVQGPLSGNVILIHSPEHLTGVFDQDVTASVRSVFDSLEQSRHLVEENEVPVGISTDWTKPEWNDLKRGTIDTILKGSGNYFHLSEVAADSLVSNIRRNRNVQNCVSEDFMDDIKRWSLEGLCSVVLEKSFGFLERKPTRMSWNMEPDKLNLAIEEATHCLNKCERGFQLWRLMSTPSAMGLGRAYRSISSILSKAIYQAEVNLKGKAELLKNGSSLPVKDLTFLESMLLNDGMTADEITCNLVDIILIGTNAMNSAMGFLFYNLAQNVKVQMKLLRELKEVLPTKDCQLNYSDLSSLKYLQACLKETLRLNFPVPIFYRLLQNDILLANYIVPKGTYIVMDFRVSSMKEQIFDDPDKFIPERWLLDEKWLKDLHPFGAFPLCHGPRAEMVKRVIEMQMLACIAKVIRNFQIEYQYGEIQGTDAIISVPEKPLKLNFVEREI